MSADILRQAASLMRERANAAMAGPWSPPDMFGVIRATYGSADDGETVHGEDCGCGGGVGYEPNLNHIASWHPGVALAVADWLDWLAARSDSGNDVPAMRGQGLEQALSVARAYLGSAA